MRRYNLLTACQEMICSLLLCKGDYGYWRIPLPSSQEEAWCLACNGGAAGRLKNRRLAAGSQRVRYGPTTLTLQQTVSSYSEGDKDKSLTDTGEDFWRLVVCLYGVNAPDLPMMALGLNAPSGTGGEGKGEMRMLVRM